MRDFVLNGTLPPRFREAGLELIEPDDHTLELRNGNQLVARFSAKVTVSEILEEAEKWLIKQKTHAD